MKKIFMTVFALLASFGVLANSMLPVSAPTLASEMTIDGTYVAEAQIAAQRGVAPPPIQPPTASTELLAPAPIPVPAPAPVPISIPRVVKMSDPIAVVESQPVKETAIALAPPANSIPLVTPNGAPGDYLVSKWLEVPLYVIDRVRTSNFLAQQQNIPDVPAQPIVKNENTHLPTTKASSFRSIRAIASALALAPATILERVVQPKTTSVVPKPPAAVQAKTVAYNEPASGLPPDISQVAPATGEEIKPHVKLLANLSDFHSAIFKSIGLKLEPVPEASARHDDSPLLATENQLAITETVPTTVDKRLVEIGNVAKTSALSLASVANALPEVSLAIFKRIAYTPPPEPIADSKTPEPTINTAVAKTKPDVKAVPIETTITTLATGSPAQPLPVTVTSQAKFSREMLAPLARIPQPSEMSVSDAEIAPNTGGPSIESLPVNDSEKRTVNTNKRAESTPVLITAQSGFSAEMLKPLSTRPVFPPNPFTVSTPQYSNGILPLNYQEGSYCDPKFVGPPIRFSQTVELKFEDLLNQLNSRFGVNFILASEIGKLPLNVKAGSIPWNVLLRSQLYVSGVKATCVDENTIELVLNSKVADLDKGRREAEKLESRYIKLKYLQPSSSSNKNVAGQSTTGGSGGGQGGQGQGGCQQQTQGGGGGGGGQGGAQQAIPQRCKFERLMNEIRQILGLSEAGAGVERIVSEGGSTVTYKTSEYVKRPYVGQVPGRNMLLVNATPSQLGDIDELIKRADVPPFQVLIKALVYTANEDKLKDIGVQTTITDTGGGRTTGGIFGHTLGSLGTLFDFSTLVGTVDFNVQASALQRDGVISIKSRPFATVLDGDTTDLTVGRQVPVLIQAVNPINGLPGTLQILQAANLLSVTPHVIDDDKGNPTAVNLELQLESNDVDQSVNSQGIPAISVRSIQSNFILNQEQTAILGGFTVDSDSKTITKTPGLGDIPILGELFKRRVRSTQINRLYFAISVTVIPYGGVIEPVKVPGADPDPPSLTPELLKRAKQAEPKSVVPPKKDPFR